MMSHDEVSEQVDAVQISQGQILNITLLASEWKSSAGGLSTLNRELAIHLAQIPSVRVSLFVPEGACNDEDKREARSFGISILDAKKFVGLDPLFWLSNPPQDHKIDVIVGHGVKLGCQVQLIKRNAQFQNCKWVHVVHTAPEDLSICKDYGSPISRGEKKHWDEIGLCRGADLVVLVGPKLRKAYHSYLQECKKNEDFFELTPGLFEREFGDLLQVPKDEKDHFNVLLCGRGDEEELEVEGCNIAVKAFADKRLKGKHYFLLVVGSPEGKQDEVRQRLLKYGITDEQLIVRECVKRREMMKDLLCEVDTVVMPSKSEGFGLVALEALSAGLPVLVGKNSGFARAIKNIPLGQCSIVRNSEDPVRWAEAIENVRDRHEVVLKESEILKKHYNEKYRWKTQCKELVDRLRRMVYGTSSALTVAAADKVEQCPSAVPESVCQTGKGKGNSSAQAIAADDLVEQCPSAVSESVCQPNPTTVQNHIEISAVTSGRGNGMDTDNVKRQISDQQLPSVSSQTFNEPCSVHKRRTNNEEKALATCKNKQNMREVGESFIKHLVTMPRLKKEQQRALYKMLASQVQTYAEFQDHSIKGVGAMKAAIEKNYHLLLENVDIEGRTGPSAAQPMAPEDSIKQRPLAIPQAVCPPDPTKVQQQFKELASTSGSKNLTKLGKRGISETTAEHVIDSVHNFGGLAFVRGFSEGISYTESTAWVRGDCYPRHVEVVTRFPLFGNSMVALVDQWRGRACLNIGLIFPEDRTRCYPKSGEYPQVRGQLWAWRSQPGQIYSKTFDSNCKKANCPQSLIAYHDCKITAGATLRIYCDVKKKTVHFSISGKEQFVSTCSRQELDFCYGFMHLRCGDNDSEIQVTLFPAINDEAASSEIDSVETAPRNTLRDLPISVGPKSHEKNQALSSYTMNRPGICLLINNVKNSTGDGNLLTNLFSSLGFHVEVERDLSMRNIIEVAQEFAKRDHSSYDSLVFIVLSQCSPGELIVGVDRRKVILKQVMSEFRPCNSTSLENKPKLFFVLWFVKTQSAERHSGGTEFCTDTTIALPQSCTTSIQEVCPEEADFLLACATSPIVKGKKIKQPEHSFTEMMVNAVSRYHQTYDLLEMLTLLNHWTDNLHKKNGQSNVMVTHTLRYKVRFGLPSLSRYDEHKTECPGYCVIINNRQFQGNDEAYRKGSEQDVERLRNLFESLRFEVIIKRDLKRDQIEGVAKEYGGKNHDKFVVFVLIVMSHGNHESDILGVDNKSVSVGELMEEFQIERCPSLKGKPKILIIQTCRGSRQCDVERHDDSVQSINADPTEFHRADNRVDPFSLDSSLSKSVFPLETDFLLAFATVPGYVSFRSKKSGAFFIQELVEVIEEYHGSHHLLDMLTEVTRRVIDHQNRAFDPARDKVQAPALTHTLTKLLYL
ncbi:uncharacterized protein [Acropora muricata]|uniref:uncharacterized protein isoform X2 n=1 Tax=Acropora muricata TaxID=159855 RepID=UPI0034E51585